MKILQVIMIAAFAGCLATAYASQKGDEVEQHRTKEKYYVCHYCKQQHFGNNPPRNVNCPSREDGKKHWWIPKYKK